MRPRSRRRHVVPPPRRPAAQRPLIFVQRRRSGRRLIVSNSSPVLPRTPASIPPLPHRLRHQTRCSGSTPAPHTRLVPMPDHPRPPYRFCQAPTLAVPSGSIAIRRRQPPRATASTMSGDAVLAPPARRTSQPPQPRAAAVQSPSQPCTRCGGGQPPPVGFNSPVGQTRTPASRPSRWPALPPAPHQESAGHRLTASVHPHLSSTGAVGLSPTGAQVGCSRA